MKRMLSVVSALMSLTAASALANEKPWNFGDLVGSEDFSTFKKGEEHGPSLLYRATTQAQLEAHSRKRVQIVVHKSMKDRGYQYLTLSVDGVVMYDAPVSTAWEREAKAKTRTYKATTPPGKFFPDGMQLKRFSNTWQVWLQHVIRFNSGIWIHATTPDHFAELGAPASGGCVRMFPSDAKEVYQLVEKFGMDETAISVLAASSDEQQIPWKLQPKRTIPQAVQEWRAVHLIK